MPFVLPADLPILLLPLRLETRFRGDQLLIRAYPDELQISDHTPELTAAELAAGRRYLDGGTRDREALVSVVGPHRAGWVEKVMAPYARWIADGRRGDAPLPPVRAQGSLPTARGLPSRLIAHGYLGGERVFAVEGAPIRDGLAIAPTQRDGDGPFDRSTRWLHDFEEARRLGMALIAPLGPRAAAVRAQGLSRLVVLGARDGASADGAETIAELLDDQRWSRGAAYLPVGTPTNHTADETAGATTTERPVVAGENRATRMMRTLGVELPALMLPHGDVDDEGLTRTTHELLWPATWGYFLPQWMGVADAALLEWLRLHFIAHVRARGPLPSLRVGAQPYGILPVMAAGTSSDEPHARALAALLAQLRAGPFERAASRVPTLVGGEPSAEKLDEIFARGPETTQLRARLLYGRHHLTNLLQLARVAPSPATTEIPSSTIIPVAPGEQYSIVGALPALSVTGDKAAATMLERAAQHPAAQLTAFGFTWRPRLAGAVFGSETWPVSPAPALADTFLTNPRPARLAELRAAKPSSVLGRLLRHAGLLVAAQAAKQASGTTFVDGELVSTPNAPWGTTVGGVDGERWLDQQAFGTASTPWKEWWRLFRDISSAFDLPQWEAISRGVIDLASHRLDAWITSLATRQLLELRRTKPKGLLLGAFGVIEDLRPHTGPSFGHLHAPSLTHAATGAVLAAGHEAHRGAGDPFQIDLSAERVRRALSVLEASTSRPLGAVLGERVERELAEAGAGGEIARLRALAPLADTPAGHPRLDGLALARRASAQQAGTEATFEAWVRIDHHGEDLTSILNQWNQSADDAVLFGLMANGQLTLAWRLQGGTTWGSELYGSGTSSGIVPLARWVHVAAVRSGASLRFYIEGRAAGEARMGGAPFVRSTLPLRLGAQQRGGKARALAGQLKNVRVWSIARTAAELVHAARADATFGWSAGVQAAWPLDGDGADLASERVAVLGGDARFEASAARVGNTGYVEVTGEPLVYGQGLAPAVVGTDRRTAEIIERLLDTTDAVTDLVLAEGVHRWVDGSMERAGEHLARFDEGRGGAQRFDVVRSPRRTSTVTHRVVALAPPAEPISLPPHNLRPHTSPRLEAWARALLGPLERLAFTARFLDARGELMAERRSDLAELGLSTLDVVFGGTCAGAATPSELTTFARVRLLAERPNAFDVELSGLALDPLLQGAEAVWRMFTVGRPLAASDLSWPPPLNLDEAVDPARGRVVEALGAIARRLREATDDQLLQRLSEAWLAGVSGALVEPRAPLEVRRARAVDVAAELERRRASPAEEGLAALLGNGFVTLPDLLVDADALRRARLDGREDRRRAAASIAQRARVRPALGALTDALLASEALTDHVARFVPLQWPRAEGEPWLGEATPPSGGRLSVVAALPPGGPWPSTTAGLLLDEHVEALPALEETTGIAFHHVAPRAAPPQAMLLGVPHPGLVTWSADTIEAVITEALALARVRAVDYRDLGEAQHFLPAITLAHNAADETVSSDLPVG